MDLQPRFRIWLKSIGWTPEDYEAASKAADGDPVRVTVGGEELLAAYAYVRWSEAQWTEWANHLGFKHGKDGTPARHNAILAGHSNAEHHRWLAAKYGVEYESPVPSLSPIADFR